jgi:hypothetical protein
MLDWLFWHCSVERYVEGFLRSMDHMKQVRFEQFVKLAKNVNQMNTLVATTLTFQLE